MPLGKLRSPFSHEERSAAAQTEKSRRSPASTLTLLSQMVGLARTGREFGAAGEYEQVRADFSLDSFDDALAHGRLAAHADLEAKGLVGEDGLLIGYLNDRAIRHPRGSSGLIYGPPGIGKDVTLIDPLMADVFDRSVFCVDVSGETRTKVGRHRDRKQSQSAARIAPYQSGSARYNPNQPLITLVEQGLSLGLVPYEIAKGYVPPSTSGHEGAWVRRGAGNLTAELLRLDVLTHGAACTPGAIFDQLNGGAETLGPKFVAMTRSGNLVLEQAGKRYLNRMEHSPREFGFIVDEAAEFMMIYQEGSPLRTATNASDVTPAELKLEPRTVFFEIPGDQMFIAQQYVAAVISSFVDGIAMAPGKTRTLFLANEFTQIGLVPNLRKALRLYRKYGVQFLLYSQSRSAIEEIYGAQGRRDIEENCEFIQILGTDDPGLIQDIQTWSGTRMVRLREVSLNGGGAPSVGEKINLSTRPVLQSENIRSLGPNEQLIKYTNMPLILAERRYWKDDPYLRTVIEEPSDLPGVL